MQSSLTTDIGTALRISNPIGKTGWWSIGVLVLWSSVAASLLGQEPAETPSISVSGSAVVKVKPNRAVVRFGIETTDADIAKAKEANRELYEAAMKAIEAAGLSRDDVQTDQLSVAPKYEGTYNRRKFVGYATRISFAVTLDDPAKLEDVVTRVLKAGVNGLDGVSFETRDYKKHREEARRLALLAAKEKAEKMASVLGMEIGNPVRIVEDRSYGSWPRAGGMAQNIAVAPSSGFDGGGPLALGRIAIRASVEVTFSLRVQRSRLPRKDAGN